MLFAVNIKLVIVHPCNFLFQSSDSLLFVSDLNQQNATIILGNENSNSILDVE